MLNAVAPPTTTVVTSSLSIPVEFLCPITGKIMDDPVVATINGHSYERKAIEALFDTTLTHLADKRLFPNQVLKSLIQDFQVPAKQPTSTEEIPDDLHCPIDLGILKDPVVLADGYSYTRGNAARWLDGKVVNTEGAHTSSTATSPKDGRRLPDTTLVPNYALMSYIQSFLNNESSSLHLPPQATDSLSLPVWSPIISKALKKLLSTSGNLMSMHELLIIDNIVIPQDIYALLIIGVSNRITSHENNIRDVLPFSAFLLEFLTSSYASDPVLTILLGFFASCFVIGEVAALITLIVGACTSNYTLMSLGGIAVYINFMYLLFLAGGLWFCSPMFRDWRDQLPCLRALLQLELIIIKQDAPLIFAVLLEKNIRPQQSDITLAIERKLPDEIISALRNAVEANQTQSVYAVDNSHVLFQTQRPGYIEMNDRNDASIEDNTIERDPPLYSNAV